MEAVKWVFFLLVMIGVAAVPFMMILNKKNKDRNENQIESAISGAGSTLYSQLVKQVDEYRHIADKAFKERNDLFERVTKLENMAIQFSETKELVTLLRSKLDAKDQEIRDLLLASTVERSKFLEVLSLKDSEIIRRDIRIEQLEHNVSDLTVRLARDEARQLFGRRVCPFEALDDEIIAPEAAPEA